jgi:hypothetical protein
LFVAAVVFALFLSPAALSAQAVSGMPTLAAGSFGKLEARLHDALRARDRRALETLLAKDFELRDISNPSELMLRDEFIEKAKQGSAVACGVEQLMPRLWSDTAVISFVCTSSSGGDTRLAVDVWRKSGAVWRLAIRYLGAETPRTGEGTIRK